MPIYGYSVHRYGTPVKDNTIKGGIYTGKFIADPDGKECAWEYLDSSRIPKYEPGPMPETFEPKRRVQHD